MVSPTRNSESGFTLAGAIVLVTIVALFAAYTVPRKWSTLMQRERELHTIFLMKQHARAIKTFQRKHNNTYPTSLDQIKDARSPRMIRGLKTSWICPLTGKDDWILIPPAAGQQEGVANQGGGQLASTTFNKAASPDDYANGPIAGVRPRIAGKSLLKFNGADTYENWGYTTFDVDRERVALAEAVKPKFR